MSKKISRADFLKASSAGLAAMTVVPNNVMGAAFGHKAPSDKLNIAAVGIGGMGHSNINGVKNTENIVALCDTDWNYAKAVFEEFPKAQRFWDWREMYDKAADQIDAVICATPDHTHALVSASAMELGKHIYCQKPLAHSVYESRLLTKLAAKTGVATQMGNQGSSGVGVETV
ncbi:MAG: Gfo/Idh/MocA family oxidoreductase, partial [Alistipes sp.]|nr:Gfo/Idh/MocA family oxidoreductase [Alistipes sp.]